MTDVTYRDWLHSYGQPSRRPAYDEEEARGRWSAGEGLSILSGDPGHPEIVTQVDLGGRRIKVQWLDDLRPELSYLFIQPEGWPDGELFLEQTQVRQYDQQRLPEGASSYDESWYFSTDGSYYAVRGKRVGSDAERAEGHLEPEQLLTLRETRPAFGDWDSIIRRER